MEEVKPVKDITKKPQKAVTEDSIVDRVNTLEKQMEEVLKAIRMNSEYNMNVYLRFLDTTNANLFYHRSILNEYLSCCILYDYQGHHQI